MNADKNCALFISIYQYLSVFISVYPRSSAAKALSVSGPPISDARPLSDSKVILDREFD
jgi:hypothetical protein